MNTRTVRPIALLALSSLLLTTLPADATYPFGSMVDKNDFDFQPELSIRPNAGGATTKIFLPCFADDNSDGLISMNEAVYLAVTLGVPGTCQSVHGKYIRLTPVGPHAAGTEVKGSAESDWGTTLTQLGTPGVPAHALRVYKVDSDPVKVKKVDTVYLDTRNLAGMSVDVGDMRLAPFGTYKAGTIVQAGDADINNPLVEIAGGATKTFYTASAVYEYGKSWYINVDFDAATKGVEEGDVRLTAAVPNLQGDIMASIGNPGKIVDSIMVTPDVARPGQKVDVVITVKNTSTKVGSALVETKLDGTIVDARGTPTLVKDEVAKLQLTMEAPMEVGRHKVRAGDVTFFLDVEGTPESDGPSQADFDALNARIDALQSQVAALAAKAAAPIQPLAAEVQTEQAPAASPAVVFAGLIVLVALVVRRRA